MNLKQTKRVCMEDKLTEFRQIINVCAKLTSLYDNDANDWHIAKRCFELINKSYKELDELAEQTLIEFSIYKD